VTAGRIIDNKYRVIELLGQGGMGMVYKAEHMVLRRRVAIKLLNETHSSDPSAAERFLIEAQAAGTIGHPNIVEVQDIGRDGDTIYMVMELLEGRDLAHEIEDQGRLPYQRAVAIMLQVLSALHAAHQKGIIHRDLKPENIFIATDSRGREEIKLLDFGVAKVQHRVDTSVRLTQTGLVVGTPVYMSPEQARGAKEIDPQTDIWACGVILYSMLSGELPFSGNSYNEVISNILLTDPPRLIDTIPDLPRVLGTAVERALSKKTEVRYQYAAEMMEAIMPFHDAHSGSISPRAAVAIAGSISPSPAFAGDIAPVGGARDILGDAPSRGAPHESPVIGSPPDAMTDNGGPGEELPDTVPSDSFVDLPEMTSMGPARGEAAHLPSGFAHHWREWLLRRPRKAVIGIGAGLLSVGVALFLVVRTSSGLESTGPTGSAVLPRSPHPGAATGGLVGDSPRQRPGEQKDGASKPAGPREDLPEDLPATAPDRDETVELTITDLAEGAVVTVDGEATASPIRVGKSDTPVSLEVMIDGSTRYSATVVPDDDKQIRMSPAPGKTPPHRKGIKRERKRKEDRSASRRRVGGDFAENPF
jgi:eukaryotic-like serine/threonine-protein kinase